MPGAIAGAVVLAPWWIWCTITFGTPIPTSGSAAHDLAPLRPFAREGMAQVAGAVVGGPFDVWRSLRLRLNDHPVVGVAVFWALVVALLVVSLVVDAARHRCRRLAVAALARVRGRPVGVLRVVRRGLVLHAVPRAGGVRRGVDDRGVGRPAWRRIAAPRREPRPWRVLALLLLVPIVAAVRRRTRHSLTATEGTESAFDSVTGYRDAARAVAAVPPAGSVLGRVAERRVRLLRQ